jgi:hypothetical protein
LITLLDETVLYSQKAMLYLIRTWLGCNVLNLETIQLLIKAERYQIKLLPMIWDETEITFEEDGIEIVVRHIPAWV